MDFFYKIVIFSSITSQIFGLQIKKCIHENPIKMYSYKKEVSAGCFTDKFLTRCELFKKDFSTVICSYNRDLNTNWKWKKSFCQPNTDMTSNFNYGCQFKITDVTWNGLYMVFHIIII